MRDSSLRLPAVMLTTQQAEIKAPAAAARISIKVQAAVAVILTAVQAKPLPTGSPLERLHHAVLGDR